MNYEMSLKAWVLRSLAQADEPSRAIRQQADMRAFAKPAPRKTFHNSINSKKYVHR